MRSAEIIIGASFDGTHAVCISSDFTGYFLETMYYFNVFGFWLNWKLCCFLMCCRTKIKAVFLGGPELVWQRSCWLQASDPRLNIQKRENSE